MRVRLIQPQELFGPPERQDELRECWRRNDEVFDEVVKAAGRPTFNDLFSMCDPDAVNVIANSDIYFGQKDVSLIAMIPHGHCWALSRWDADATGYAKLHDHPDSQDAWVFNGRPDGIDAPFAMGVPGCDNRLAYLIREAGYNVSNPSRTVRAMHLHGVQWRSYLHDAEGHARGGEKKEVVPGPYAFVKPTYL